MHKDMDSLRTLKKLGSKHVTVRPGAASQAGGGPKRKVVAQERGARKLLTIG
jgi:hypothetical protein